VMLKTVKLYDRGEIEPIEQLDEGITYAPKISGDICIVRWEDAQKTYNLYRGVTPYPGACFFFGDERVRICDMDLISNKKTGNKQGTILSIDGKSVTIACGVGEVRLNRLRPAGKGDMEAAAFVRGRDINVGKVI